MAQQITPFFRSWVPRWLCIATIFIVLIPIIMINGAYVGSSLDISGAMGILSEDISMAYYAASLGMAASYPLIYKIRPFVTTKLILLTALIWQIILSYFCARTENIEVIIICSFFIGSLKGAVLMEFMGLLQTIFSPKNMRWQFYSYFYPLMFGVGQISMVITAELAFRYYWQYMYYFVIILLIVAVIFVLLCMRYVKQPERFNFRHIDWGSYLLAALTGLLLIYIATYGKTYDWFSSKKILYATMLLPPMIICFFYRQYHASNPFVQLGVFRNKKSIIAYGFMIFVMIISSSSALITSYATTILRVDNRDSNLLNLWLIPGFVIGAAFCNFWYRKNYRFRVLVAWGMGCFVAYAALLYDGVAPTALYESLYLPMILRGAGMIILFIAFGVFAVEDLNPKLMIYNAFFLILFRSALSPAIGKSFFITLFYRMQQQNNLRIAEQLDLTNPIVYERYTQLTNQALRQGYGSVEAAQKATYSLYQTLQSQSMLISLKQVFGYILIVTLVVTLFSRFFPFHKTRWVKTIKTGDDMA